MNSGTAPLQNIAILRQVKQVEVTGTSDIIDGRGFAKHNITRGLSALEKLAKGCASNPGAGVFLGGSVTPTIADICLIPQLYNANRFGIDLEQFPTLMAIQKNCENMEAFKKAHPESQPDFK